MMAFLAIAGNAVWGQNPTTIDVTASQSSDGKITAYSFQYSAEQDSRILEIKQPGDYTIQGKSGSGNNSNVQISISTAGTYNITLDNVRVDAYLGNDLDGTSTEGEGKYPDRCAFEIGANVTVNLDWKNSNTLWSGPNRAGINVKENATLILKGTNNTATLIVGSYGNGTGTNAITYGAGIGGDKNDPDFGTIIIESGKVEAYSRAMGSQGSANGAGIGGGYSDSQKSAQGTIIIKGGDITAQCNVKDYYQNGTEKGAGIGGGFQGTCEQITIIGKEDATVKVQSYSGADIGVGDGYTGSAQPEIIIGKWDKDATISVAESDNANVVITDENYVDGYTSTPSASGTVTMPDDMQIYVANLKINDGAIFKAYNATFEASSLGEDASHQPSGLNTEIQNYYYGANRSFTVSDLTCTEHLFLGWLKTDSENSTPNVDYNDENTSASFTMPNTTPTVLTKYKYKSVWVNKTYAVTVASGTEWGATTENPPRIAYSPKEALDKLTFTAPEEATELGKFTFAKNILTGTPTLKEDDSVERVTLNVNASLDGGKTEVVTIEITCVEEIIINKVKVATKDHIYNGNIHNGTYVEGAVNDDYVLDVTMYNYNDKEDIDEVDELREGVHYRIIRYEVGGETSNIAEGQKTLPIINAGIYSNLVVEAIDATFASKLNAKDNKTLTVSDPVTVAQRPMNITFSVEGDVVEGEEPTINVNPEKFVTAPAHRGLVAGENPKVSYKIDYQYNADQTQMTVYIDDIVVDDNLETGFRTSNYDMKYVINGITYKTSADQGGEGEDFPEDGVEIGTIDVVPPTTGGGTTDKRYQLFLANKDYLKTDEKTVEYYEDLKLELFSRHNRKYTDAGGSFTIWYEKDGEANVGGYRLFWSKSGEHGDYQEVKFDPVSEYFRIDNVHSDVYVKIYDADGFPVANEAITAQDFRAYAQPNKIIVITPQPTDVQIISMAGAVVATDKVTGQREFANLAEGVYIVRMGETIVKLQVRN